MNHEYRNKIANESGIIRVKRAGIMNIEGQMIPLPPPKVCMYMYVRSLLLRISFSITRSRQPKPKQELYARKLVEAVKVMTNKGRNKTVNSHF